MQNQAGLMHLVINVCIYLGFCSCVMYTGAATIQEIFTLKKLEEK